MATSESWDNGKRLTLNNFKNQGHFGLFRTSKDRMRKYDCISKKMFLYKTNYILFSESFATSAQESVVSTHVDFNRLYSNIKCIFRTPPLFFLPSFHIRVTNGHPVSPNFDLTRTSISTWLCCMFLYAVCSVAALQTDNNWKQTHMYN